MHSPTPINDHNEVQHFPAVRKGYEATLNWLPIYVVDPRFFENEPIRPKC
jgi:hypothetical protein